MAALPHELDYSRTVPPAIPSTSSVRRFVPNSGSVYNPANNNVINIPINTRGWGAKRPLPTKTSPPPPGHRHPSPPGSPPPARSPIPPQVQVFEFPFDVIQAPSSPLEFMGTSRDSLFVTLELPASDLGRVSSLKLLGW